LIEADEKFGEGYWLAGIGQVWPRPPPHDAIRMAHYTCHWQ